jgi:hypothetical protein
MHLFEPWFPRRISRFIADQVVLKGALLKLLVPFEEQKIRPGFKPIFLSMQKEFQWPFQVLDCDCGELLTFNVLRNIVPPFGRLDWCWLGAMGAIASAASTQKPVNKMATLV